MQQWSIPSVIQHVLRNKQQNSFENAISRPTGHICMLQHATGFKINSSDDKELIS